MSEIEEHQRRIAEALERIAALTDALPASRGQDSSGSDLAAAELRAVEAEVEAARLREELAALRALRAEERGEIEDILGRLAPILESGEVRHAGA